MKANPKLYNIIFELVNISAKENGQKNYLLHIATNLLD